MIKVKFSEIEEAFDFVSSGSPYTHNAYVSRDTGEIFWESERVESEADLPPDLGEPERYIYVPHRTELDLGKRLVLRFVNRELPDDYPEVEDYFHGDGAHERFRVLLARRGKEDAWDEYEREQTQAALREWGREEGIDFD